MSTDPRELDSGGIAGPGGPHTAGGVVVDARRAVLPDATMVTTIDDPHGQHPAPLAAMSIAGRVNKSTDRVDIVFILNPDAAAAIITELIALGGRDIAARRAAALRDGVDATDLVADGWGAQLRIALDDRQERLAADGHTG